MPVKKAVKSTAVKAVKPAVAKVVTKSLKKENINVLPELFQGSCHAVGSCHGVGSCHAIGSCHAVGSCHHVGPCNRISVCNSVGPCSKLFVKDNVYPRVPLICPKVSVCRRVGPYDKAIIRQDVVEFFFEFDLNRNDFMVMMDVFTELNKLSLAKKKNIYRNFGYEIQGDSRKNTIDIPVKTVNIDVADFILDIFNKIGIYPVELMAILDAYAEYEAYPAELKAELKNVYTNWQSP